MALVKTKTALGKSGGTKGTYKEVTEVGVNTSGPDTWHDTPYRASTGIEDNNNEEMVHGEAGELQGIIPGTILRTMTVKLNQFDAALINYLRSGGSDKYFSFFFDWGYGANGKKLELWIPLAKIKKGGKFDRPTAGTEMVIYILDNPAFTAMPASVPSFAVGVASDYTVVAGEGYGVYEITPA